MTESFESSATEPTVRQIELSELESGVNKGGRSLLDENHEFIKNIKVRLNVSVGKSELTVKDLLALKEDSIVALDKGTRDPVEVYLDGKLVARGELVAVDDNFGVRISEILVG